MQDSHSVDSLCSQLSGSLKLTIKWRRTIIHKAYKSMQDSQYVAYVIGIPNSPLNGDVLLFTWDKTGTGGQGQVSGGRKYIYTHHPLIYCTFVK